MKLWPHQERTLAAIRSSEHRRICVQGPTGCGKTRVITELTTEAAETGKRVVVLTHRKMLGDQMSGSMVAAGIEHGRRASGYKPALLEDVQLSSIQTEESRVYKSGKWALHAADLVIVDECHCFKGATAAKILGEYDQAVHVGVSATPYAVGEFYDTMIQMASMDELRACGALVLARHIGVNEPDTHKIRRTAAGEYTYKAITKVLKIQTVVGSIVEEWKRLCPAGEATIATCPGVAESLWLAKDLQRRGIVAAHIDAESVWCDGHEMENNSESREAIAEGSRNGHIQIVCHRFVLREGINWPWIRNLILATVFGSPQTYIQNCGRGLRAYPGKPHLVIQDHGGNWWRHGSVNQDKIWDLDSDVNRDIAERDRKIREGEEPEPIRCPKCSAIRASGPKCPECGYGSPRRMRMILQANGKLIEHAESCFPKRPTKIKDDTQEIWNSIYHRMRRGKRRPNFRQARGLFFHENRYWPPDNMKYMPVDPRDWHRPVADVPKIRLHGFQRRENER